jgi:hypothetical protein
MIEERATEAQTTSKFTQLDRVSFWMQKRIPKPDIEMGSEESEGVEEGSGDPDTLEVNVKGKWWLLCRDYKWNILNLEW